MAGKQRGCRASACLGRKSAVLDPAASSSPRGIIHWIGPERQRPPYAASHAKGSGLHYVSQEYFLLSRPAAGPMLQGSGATVQSCRGRLRLRREPGTAPSCRAGGEPHQVLGHCRLPPAASRALTRPTRRRPSGSGSRTLSYCHASATPRATPAARSCHCYCLPARRGSLAADQRGVRFTGAAACGCLFTLGCGGTRTRDYCLAVKPRAPRLPERETPLPPCCWLEI